MSEFGTKKGGLAMDIDPMTALQIATAIFTIAAAIKQLIK